EAEIFERRTVQFFGHRDHAKRDWQVEAGPLFLDIGGGKIDGGAAARPVIAAIRNCRRDPVAALFHSGIWQANDDNIRISAGAVYFDLDFVRGDALNRLVINFGEHSREVARETTEGEASKVPCRALAQNDYMMALSTRHRLPNF